MEPQPHILAGQSALISSQESPDMHAGEGDTTEDACVQSRHSGAGQKHKLNFSKCKCTCWHSGEKLAAGAFGSLPNQWLRRQATGRQEVLWRVSITQPMSSFRFIRRQAAVRSLALNLFVRQSWMQFSLPWFTTPAGETNITLQAVFRSESGWKSFFTNCLCMTLVPLTHKICQAGSSKR